MCFQLVSSFGQPLCKLLQKEQIDLKEELTPGWRYYKGFENNQIKL